MGESKHDGLTVPGCVVLAHEAPFRLGCLTFLPSTRQVISDRGRRTVEPRVMQVLVVLFRAAGDIVTRDELVETCWEGRVVGDDAINRAIGKTRRLVEEARGEFRVETIARVGYRLVGCGPGEVAAPDRALSGSKLRASHAPTRRKFMISAGAAVAVGGAGAAFWSLTAPVHKPSALATLYYQRGIDARGQNSQSHGEQAVAYFRQATRIDPDYAKAWGALAWGYRSLLEYGPRPDTDRLAMFARSAAHRALELDPGDPDARAALLLLTPLFRNWAEIERGCREILAEHPTHSLTRFYLGMVAAQTGRWLASIPHFQELVAQEPFWSLARMQLFRALRAAGRLDDAEEQLGTAERLWPRRADIWSAKIRHLLLSSRGEEAVAFLENGNLQPTDSDRVVEWDRLVAHAYVSGSAERKGRATEELLARVEAFPGAAVPAALDCCMLGDVDAAFSLLNGYIFGRGRWSEVRSERPAIEILFNVMTTPLRRDARFAPLLVEIGLEDHWRGTGTQPDYRRLG